MPHADVVPVPRKAIDDFRRDGAVVLKGVLDVGWRRELERGIAALRSNPGRHRVDWVRDDATGDHVLFDAALVPDNPFFASCMTASPLGPIAARMMESPTALAFYVSMFLRSPGTSTPTPWHQDQTYWCAEGRQALSIWTSLDPVPAGTELQFVRGSHLWDRPLAQPFFEHEQLGGVRDDGSGDTVAITDFAASDIHEVIGWPTEPGDVVVFHGMTVHGGSGNLPEGLGRRTLSFQWLGEDIRVTTRPGGCSPDWLPEFARYGVEPGDCPWCAMCPGVSADGVVTHRERRLS